MIIDIKRILLESGLLEEIGPMFEKNVNDTCQKAPGSEPCLKGRAKLAGKTHTGPIETHHIGMNRR